MRFARLSRYKYAIMRSVTLLINRALSKARRQPDVKSEDHKGQKSCSHIIHPVTPPPSLVKRGSARSRPKKRRELFDIRSRSCSWLLALLAALFPSRPTHCRQLTFFSATPLSFPPGYRNRVGISSWIAREEISVSTTAKSLCDESRST